MKDKQNKKTRLRKELIGYYQKFPFDGEDPFPTKITKDNDHFVSEILDSEEI